MTLTATHVAKFAEITGDYNPLHFDKRSSREFGKLVVQGGLTTGSARTRRHGTCQGAQVLSQNWKFTAQVFITDTITAAAEVMSVHPTKPVTQLAIRVTRQTGEVVLEGEAWCYTFTATPHGETR